MLIGINGDNLTERQLVPLLRKFKINFLSAKADFMQRYICMQFCPLNLNMKQRFLNFKKWFKKSPQEPYLANGH